MENEQVSCAACGGWFRSPDGLHIMSLAGACCCAEGAKIDEGARIRHRVAVRRCLDPNCSDSAAVDGWCDNHSEQFKRFGTHHPVGSRGA